ncbi:MAG: DNA/RNA nuclease SfsA [Candidatus Neomarinimicrobiota bacterium]|nr:MAG: DNA/RNA nuclease SfsA [Candidatus Neomarinimicrobiota bacterium]
MLLPDDLAPAIFVDRPNRFLIQARQGDRILACHCPDPGRLQELLLPGAELWIRPSASPQRKTEATVWLVRAPSGTLVSLYSALPNRFVGGLLRERRLPGYEGFTLIRAEVPWQHHRFDFLLESPRNRPYYLEVKSVTFVADGVARFPDAVTDRGKRHAFTLATLRKQGLEAGIVFICQRADAVAFRPMWDRDPAFARTLGAAADAGVDIHCFTTRVTRRKITLLQEIPVNLDPE